MHMRSHASTSATPRRAVPHASPRHAVRCDATPHRAAPRCATPRHTAPRNATPCHPAQHATPRMQARAHARVEDIAQHKQATCVEGCGRRGRVHRRCLCAYVHACTTCDATRHDTALCSPVQPRAAPCSPVQPRAAPCSLVQPRAAPCSPVQPRAASMPRNATQCNATPSHAHAIMPRHTTQTQRKCTQHRA